MSRRLVLETLEDRLAPGEVLTAFVGYPLNALAGAALVAASATDDAALAADSVRRTDGDQPDALPVGNLDPASVTGSPLLTTAGGDYSGDNATAPTFVPANDRSDVPIGGSFSPFTSAAYLSAESSSSVLPTPAPTSMPGSDLRSFAPAAAVDNSLASMVVTQLAAGGTAGGLDAGSNDAGAAIPLLHLRSARPFRGPGGGGGTPAGYTPAQIRHAYGFDQLPQDGAGQTIAIVDAYDDPNIVSDLNTFSTQFGLPTTTSGAFTFTKAFAQGSQPTANGGWAQEISLDVEWAHAIAPRANILLVEAASNSFANLFGAVDYAVNQGAHIVSMSWGATDFSSETSFDSHFNKPGVMFVASAGDSGGVVNYPAASPDVLSVGGTTLPLDSSGNRTGAESAWSSGGGGSSAYEAEPGYQVNFGITITNGHRGTPDVAYDANPNTGFAVYDSFSYQGRKGWLVFGGTSAGAPQWAALAALVDQARPTWLTSTDVANSKIYDAAVGSRYASNYTDITTGSNGFPATTGYDLATGLGSPLANALVPYLIAN